MFLSVSNQSFWIDAVNYVLMVRMGFGAMMFSRYERIYDI